MTYFSKILIANRGEIAIRIMRACRDLGIATVAVYSEADADALHVRAADEAVLLGPAAPGASYLNVERIIAAARQTGAQAIHPGYGFLSERAHFARACAEAGMVFIGPPERAIELMGSKIAAKRLAEEAGVPTAPGYMGDDQSPARLRAEAERIGLPLLIKASAGGGGKGMRTVQHMDAFDDALEGAKREARAAFGDDAVFLEKLIIRPRHIEIQVLADQHGNAVHLFERDCSIQRRHQKIVEESPSPVLSPQLRADMGAAAVRLAQAVGYTSAGTVEFVLGEDGRPAFLEMNTRLQVEHPVTELVTGLDLVKLQIAIAAGEPLPFTQSDLRQTGHAIEVRVYAEDPATFLPATGTLALFAPASGPDIRNDAGVQTGDEVSVNYDPMLAKLIVYGPDRAAAIARLGAALDDYAVLGVTTNLPLLRAIAAHPAFAAGDTTTDFLREHGVSIAESSAPTLPAVAVAALADALQDAPSAADPWASGPWRMAGLDLRRRYRTANTTIPVVLDRQGAEWRVVAGGSVFVMQVEETRDHAFMLTINGQQVRVPYASDGHTRLIGWQGASVGVAPVGPPAIDDIASTSGKDAGHASLQAPMPGTVVQVLVEPGQQVEARQPLVVLEAMKMEHVVAAPHTGIVAQVLCAPGALVAKGATLVEIDEA